MNKRIVLILLSILYVCIFALGIILMYYNMKSQNNMVTPDEPGTTIIVPDVEDESEESIDAEIETETETAIETETETAIETETETAIETETETQTEIETETRPEVETETTTESETSQEDTKTYTFTYSKGHKNLHIRSGPSLKDEIIGRIPHGGSGEIIEFTNDEWALIEYKGIVGYCSMKWITVCEGRENP